MGGKGGKQEAWRGSVVLDIVACVGVWGRGKGHFGLCLTSELCLTCAVTDLTRNSQTPREDDFGSDRVDTQFLTSQSVPASVSSLIPSPSGAPVLCWCSKCQHQNMETQPVPEYPHQLASQSQGLHDTLRSQFI